jgi:hypothetical protein
MGRLLRYLFYLVLLAALGFAVYAFFAELPAPIREITVDVPVPEGS